MKLNHVALTVQNREASAQFYGDFFGMNIRIHDDDHLLILANEDGDLLALSAGKKDFDLPRTNHFGFQVSSTEGVLSMRNRFKNAGIEETEFSPHGPTRVQVLDPDGYRVEVYAF